MMKVYDIAAYILNQNGKMTAMKLQKLVYYSQAWSLVWDEKPLFEENVEAWANGPIVRELYDIHKGEFYVTKLKKGSIGKVKGKAKDTIDSVLKYYSGKSGQWLSDLAHKELPWKQARADLDDSIRGRVVISHASMAEYYYSML